ncbi:Peroxiredoxin-1 [Spiromyces aspiralis]|uniref:Peroxiredoxin-1 n=1 Tax=Spiromyces aspiralis TaxID=68401 RepID=A0ACC1HEL2_9FUNG|nr:Peroxiredoxin-1 [Spiromyces aspiralis]
MPFADKRPRSDTISLANFKRRALDADNEGLAAGLAKHPQERVAQNAAVDGNGHSAMLDGTEKSAQDHDDGCDSKICSIGLPGSKVSAVDVPALLETGEVGTVSLGALEGQYWVLLFYPSDFTFVCPTELLALSDRLEDFQKLGCAVLACSTDSEYVHHAWTQVPRAQGGIANIRLPLRKYSDWYAVIHYVAVDQDESKITHILDTGVTYRGLFIVDRSMTVRVAHIYDLPIGRSVDEVIRLVQALQFTDEHGEVCPVNWKPGDMTIVPDVQKSMQYFANAGSSSTASS